MNEWKPRRFWTEANATEADDGFGISLDGRRARTPGKAPLIVPTRALAEEIALEWAAQGEVIDPNTMPLTRAVNSAIEKVIPQRDAVAAGLAEYADSDLTCYRADGPEALVERQAQAWDPLLDWAADTYGARLIPVQGVIHVAQPPASLERLRRAVFALRPFELTAFSELVTLSGSLIIGLATIAGNLPPAELWQRSRVDEQWQAELWGHDEEAALNAEARETAFLRAARFYDLTRN